jgi:hypothetical protein
MNAISTWVSFAHGASVASDPAAAMAELGEQMDLNAADAVSRPIELSGSSAR